MSSQSVARRRGAPPASAVGVASAELVERLDGAVRELVRRDGVDPQRDPGLVRRLAEQVVRGHDERSLTGQVAPVEDVEALVGEIVARVSGLGPLQPYLDDPEVEENCTPQLPRSPGSETAANQTVGVHRGSTQSSQPGG
ncbi:hypothetical protein GCM10011519_33620 [Marmoricola endophyticus]|uniref:Uncharacterized protein n=1 Tax=Marmoricola endophyticus TaxID=2040280 RepID=A0A917BU63_9ACTN|nr:hypothetical protein GCM10011519_33620 [Marmoricola endophyticus]